MIRKMIAPLAIVALLFTACKKENDVTTTPTQTQDESGSSNRLLNTPVAFTQKMLFEMFGSVHCGTCPDMEQKFRNQRNANPGKIFGYVAHNSDGMDIGLYDYLDSIFSVTSYSSGMLNRTPMSGTLVLPKSRFNSTNVAVCLSKVATCGLQITTSISGTTATIIVDAGFSALMAGTYKLTTVLCEDSVVGTGYNFDQSNYYNTWTTTPWYNLGDPMVGYVHDFVPRKVLSASKIGDPIASSYLIPGGFFTKTYTVNITGYNKRQLSVIAFVNKVGTTASTHQIMNVQGTKIGTSKNFD